MVAPGIDERACWTVDPVDDEIFVMQEEGFRKVFYVHDGSHEGRREKIIMCWYPSGENLTYRNSSGTSFPPPLGGSCDAWCLRRPWS